MVRMVDSLLILARDAERRISHGENVNLADLLRDGVKRSLAEESPSDLEAPDETIVEGDEELLRIAVENPASTMPASSRPPMPRVGVRLGQTIGVVRLAIQSTRTRLADGERVFDRFSRSEEARRRIRGMASVCPSLAISRVSTAATSPAKTQREAQPPSCFPCPPGGLCRRGARAKSLAQRELTAGPMRL